MKISFSLCVAASLCLMFLLLHGSPTVADGPEMQALLKADAATRNAPHYRMTMTITDKRGVHTNTLEYVRPDRYRIRLNDGKTEMLFIGKTAYMKARGRTISLPSDRTESFDQLRPSITKEMLQNATVRRVGAEVVDNAPTTVYEVSYHDPSLSGVGRYWISDGDNLIRRMSGSANVGSAGIRVKTVGGKSAYTTTVDYKTAVEIIPPNG